MAGFNMQVRDSGILDERFCYAGFKPGKICLEQGRPAVCKGCFQRYAGIAYGAAMRYGIVILVIPEKNAPVQVNKAIQP